MYIRNFFRIPLVVARLVSDITEVQKIEIAQRTWIWTIILWTIFWIQKCTNEQESLLFGLI